MDGSRVRILLRLPQSLRPAWTLLILLVLVAPSATALLPSTDVLPSTDASTSVTLPLNLQETFLEPVATDPSQGWGDTLENKSFPELWRLIVGHLEGQGAFPRGMSEKFDALDDAEGGTSFRFSYPTADVDKDGVDDIVVNEWNLLDLSSTIRTVSGQDGHELWSQGNSLYLPLWLRPGDPFPEPTDNFLQTRDLTDDGIPEMIVFGFDIQVIAVPCFALITLPGAYRALNGATGEPLWTIPFLSTWVLTCFTAVIDNYPTGMAYYEDGETGRFLYKEMDVAIAATPCPNIFGIRPGGFRATEIIDVVYVADAKAGTPKWNRPITPVENPNHSVFSWITGATNLDGAGDTDIVLDEWFFFNPQYCESRNPITGDPLYQYGRGMFLQALKGEDGSDLWKLKIYQDPPVRTNVATEEPFPVLIWTHAQLLTDFTGDGISDPVALYLTADTTTTSTVNGIFRTHFAPVDGKKAEKLWKPDEKTGLDKAYMGWGFMGVLNEPGTNATYMAIGTTDPCTRPPPGGRFPPKDIHLAVVKAKDGGNVWSVSQRWQQDSCVAFHFTLSQFLHALAPYDWDQDGVRDLVTPAQYIKPGGRNQTVLATAKHSFEIFSGASGDVIQKVHTWGSQGLVVSCGDGSPLLTTIDGHSRRWDMSRFNVTTGEHVWRQPVYNDARLRPATAGVDLIFFNGRCLPIQSHLMPNLNFWTFSIGRGTGGHELYGIYGVLGRPDGLLKWLDPILEGNPPLLPSFAPVPTGPKASIWAAIPSWGWVVAPIIPGALGGVTLASFSRRGKPPKL